LSHPGSPDYRRIYSSPPPWGQPRAPTASGTLGTGL
jgi:hypothetical protein